MLKLVTLVTLVVTCWSIVDAGTKCGIGGPNHLNNNRIVGGGEAEPHEYPWIAYLQMEYASINGGESIYFACDGSLIDDQWIVSAGHCFAKQKGYQLNGLVVVLGAHNLANKQETRLVLKPHHVIVHELFHAEIPGSKNDISMIKLPERLDLANEHYHLTPVCLPHVGERVSKTDCQSIGWGRTSPNGPSSKLLKYVTNEILYADECKRLRPEVSDLQVCAGYLNHGTCQGDSGGPLECKNTSGAWVIQGIVSYGDKICAQERPSVYTNVEKFLNWINHVRATH